MKKKILVLDDSPFILKVISDMLTGLNYEVTTFDNGNLACQAVESNRYDMIITDMNMPDMDGIKFTQQVKKHPNCKFVPVLMLSSVEDKDKIAEARKVGISTFLSKPLNEKQFKAILQVTLNKRRAPRIPLKLEVFFGKAVSFSADELSFTFNLSAGGLFLETENLLPINERLKLKFILPENNHSVNCEGRVAWVNSKASPIRSDHPTGMGIEFLSLVDMGVFQEFLQRAKIKR